MSGYPLPSADDEDVEPPPSMAPHAAHEFLFAKKTLRRMVLDSRFFPPGADDHRWFRHRDDERDVAGARAEAESAARFAATLDTATPDAARPEEAPETPAAPAAFPDDETKCQSFLHSTSQDALGGPSLGPMAPAAEIAALARACSLDADVAPVPAIHEGDIEYGGILGQGGFCEVRLAALKTGHGRDRPPQRFAMKYLSPTKHIPKDVAPSSDGKPPPRNKPFERGIADLAIEARFLTLLSHENIIGLYHVSGGSLEEQFNCGEEGGGEGTDFAHQFGLLMLIDPLHETLAKRVDDTYVPWVFAAGAPAGTASAGSWWRRLAPARKAASLLPLESWKIQLAQRLEGLKGIAGALQYLHDDCRVIYRDCKPDNIGFYRKPHPHGGGGYTEIPKLFDFGLAKELKPKLLKAHPHHETGATLNTYRLTARSGSRRYMAPEVAFSTPYNEKADVYSFGIVLYQVASLVTPFEGYSLYRHEKEILCGRDRPNVKIPVGKRALNKIRKTTGLSHAQWTRQFDVVKQTKQLEACTKCVWTKDLRCLTEECWHDDMRERPSMQEVVTRLEGCIQELIPEDLRKSMAQETECIGNSGDSERCGREGVVFP